MSEQNQMSEADGMQSLSQTVDLVMTDAGQTTAPRMVQLLSQQELSEWLQNKVRACTEEASLLAYASTYAKSHKWRWQTLQAQSKKAWECRDFYVNLQELIKQGCTINVRDFMKCP